MVYIYIHIYIYRLLGYPLKYLFLNDLINGIYIHIYIYRPLGYERVYLPLCKVADTPFHIQGDDMFAYDVQEKWWHHLACFVKGHRPSYGCGETAKPHLKIVQEYMTNGRPRWGSYGLALARSLDILESNLGLMGCLSSWFANHT